MASNNSEKSSTLESILKAINFNDPRKTWIIIAGLKFKIRSYKQHVKDNVLVLSVHQYMETIFNRYMAQMVEYEEYTITEAMQTLADEVHPKAKNEDKAKFINIVTSYLTNAITEFIEELEELKQDPQARDIRNKIAENQWINPFKILDEIFKRVDGKELWLTGVRHSYNCAAQGIFMENFPISLGEIAVIDTMLWKNPSEFTTLNHREILQREPILTEMMALMEANKPSNGQQHTGLWKLIRRMTIPKIESINGEDTRTIMDLSDVLTELEDIKARDHFLGLQASSIHIKVAGSTQYTRYPRGNTAQVGEGQKTMSPHNTWCTYCAEHRNNRVAKTHNTADCRFKDGQSNGATENRGPNKQ